MLGWQQAQLQQLTLTATRALGHTMNAFAGKIAQWVLFSFHAESKWAQWFPSGYNVMDFPEPYLNGMYKHGWRFQLSIQQHSQIYFLLSLCSC